MAAKAGQMNLDNTAAATYAAAQTTGQMIARISTANGIMEASEPAAVTGLMKLQTHATNGLMLININS